MNGKTQKTTKELIFQAKKNGVNPNTFRGRVYTRGWSVEKAINTPPEYKKEYALYKGEQLLAIGTLKEISERMNLKTKTLHCYRYDYKAGRGKGNRKILVPLDEWEVNEWPNQTD